MTRKFRGKVEDLELVTNSDLVASAHALLNGIDLDPASSDFANTYVQAERYFKPTDDGLNNREWTGRNIYLFPPSGAYFHDKANDRWKMTRASSGSLVSSCAIWFRKLRRLWLSGQVREALFFTNTPDIIRYDQHIFDFPVCILCTAPTLVKRTSEGTGFHKTSTSLVIYLQPQNNAGAATERFIDIYSTKGRVLC